MTRPGGGDGGGGDDDDAVDDVVVRDVVRAVRGTSSAATTTSDGELEMMSRFDALSALSAALDRDDAGDVNGVLKRTEDALVECVRAPDGAASAAVAARVLTRAYAKTRASSVYSRANELMETAGSAQAPALARASAFDALTRLMTAFGDRLHGCVHGFVSAACASAKPSDDVGVKRAALKLLATTCARSNGALDERVIVVALKALVKLEGERDVGARAVRAEALGALARAWSSSTAHSKAKDARAKGAGTFDIASVVQRIVKALEDDSEWVRDSASMGLTHAAVARSQTATESMSQPAVINALEEATTNDAGFTCAMRSCLYEPLLAACGMHSTESRRVRIGIARAWAQFIHEAVRENVAEYHEIVGYSIKLLLSQPLEDDAHVCASFLYIIRVGCLAKADEASLRATLASATQALRGADISRLLISLRTARDTIEVIGSVDEDAWTSVVEAIHDTLHIDHRHVQTEAAQAMRALALACPTKLVAQLRAALRELENHVAAVDVEPSLVSFGAALHVAALVSTGEEFTSGLPSSILRDAASIGIRCATGPGSARVREGGWIVISACLAGPGAAIASKMCGLSIKFALTATFDTVVEAGGESEHGEIYAAAAAVETLSAWLIGKHSERESLLPLLVSCVTAAERILFSSSKVTFIEHAKALFRFRVFELLNTIEDTSIYSTLHERIVAVCRMRMASYAKLDECLPEGFLREQLCSEDAHLGPWSSKADAHLDQLCDFEGTSDAPHSRIWIQSVDANIYPRARSMKASTRQAQGEQLAKVFSAAPQLRAEILTNFVNLAHSIVRTPTEQKSVYETGEASIVAKKQNAMDLIQSTFSSPFKARRSAADQGEKVERLAALSLLCADVLATVKSVSSVDATLMNEFKKIAHIMQYADFASVMHWRAIAEIHSFANALHPNPNDCAKSIVSASKKLAGIPNESFLRNIAALSIAGTFRHTGAIAMNQACRQVITSLLQMSMQIDPVFSSHVWAIHAISEIGTHIGQSFVRETDDIMKLALVLVDAPFLLEQKNGAMTRIATARLINTAIAAVGPDLNHESDFFKRAETLITLLAESEAPAAKLEFTVFLQHIATFTPNTPSGQALVPKLRETLRLTSDASTTNAVMLILRHLLERDSSSVAANVGLDTELLLVLDRESNPRTRSVIKRCVELLIQDRCIRNPHKALSLLSAFALYSPTPVSTKVNTPQDEDEDDETEDGGIDVAVAHDEEKANGVERGAPKLSTRLYAAQLLASIPHMIGDERAHRCLAAARASVDAGTGTHWLPLHAQFAFDVAYRLSVSPVAALHAPGLELFANLMQLWENDEDPDSATDGDYRTMFVLEQYQAQLLSAMRATDPANASIESYLALLRLVSSALTSGIVGDDIAMGKRLANVVTKIASEWLQGTSEILCGKACDDAVAEQARQTLIVNIARIAANEPEAIPSDILTTINPEWIRVIRNSSTWSTNDEMVNILSACSTLEQSVEDAVLIRDMCFMSIMCGFFKSIPLSDASFTSIIQALSKVITANDGCIVASEVEAIRNALRIRDASNALDAIAMLMTNLINVGAVHSNARVSVIRLVAQIMTTGNSPNAVVEPLFTSALQLSGHNSRVRGAMLALLESIFTSPVLCKYRVMTIRLLRTADSTAIKLSLLKGVGHVLAESARAATREFYANKVSGGVQSATALDLVIESLQLWAGTFVSLSQNESDSMCLTSLAIFLALAVDVTAPENIDASDVDATVGQLASQLLVRLATVSAEPFRAVVSQLSQASKARLQSTLAFKAPQFVAAASTPLKSFNVVSF